MATRTGSATSPGRRTSSKSMTRLRRRWIISPGGSFRLRIDLWVPLQIMRDHIDQYQAFALPLDGRGRDATGAGLRNCQVCVNHHVTLVPATRSGGDFGGVRTGLLGAGAECRMDRTGSFTVGYIIGSLSVAVDEPHVVQGADPAGA